MSDYKSYKISPFINNSFNDTLICIIKILYDDIKLEITNCTPDCVMISDSSFNLWNKPEYVFITFNFLDNGVYTDNVGSEFCRFKLKDKKVIVNWSTNEHKNIKYEIFNLKKIRKLKLDKISRTSQKGQNL